MDIVDMSIEHECAGYKSYIVLHQLKEVLCTIFFAKFGL